MRGPERKAAIAAYKERKAAPGIFAIRCPSAGFIWVGQAPDLSTIWNRTSFMLRQGGHPKNDLQSVWSGCNGEGFSFEELERIDDEKLTAMGVERVLKERLAHWAEELRAVRL